MAMDIFKPTKAAEAQFRPTASDAMSYFVGHKAVEKGHLEDAGFAINGGKGWSNVVFENHKNSCQWKCCHRHGQLLLHQRCRWKQDQSSAHFRLQEECGWQGAHLPPPLFSAIQCAHSDFNCRDY
eukprot:s177_g17.t1